VIGNIISLPFENNFDFGVGPEDAFVSAVKPDGAADWALQLQVKLLFPK